MNDELQLDSLIKRMASEHAAELPSPGLIWWRAQILRKQEETRRIERPMMIMRLVAALVCAAVFLMAVAANGQWVQPLPMLLMIVAMVVSLVSAALLLSPAKD
jgi:magnesium-transporting ATPase (P-type)